ncbi:hypothetical protein BP00DRAFT_14595 [Aspergillus indologenus CBS 114.80]|uniref:Uncharacterized protein n=1 Tax=Aspergillus indologenus CBS 114.80 TaxID=1450541 RepID=A0A2V5I065_9EURO|nr:hypothetical protein BP00DRAFT_14595 [Aspergillus indologenus CBS 114.80]
MQTTPYAAVFYGYWLNLCSSWTLIVRIPLLTIPVSSTTQQMYGTPCHFSPNPLKTHCAGASATV